jgi:lipoprotein-releasing system ATP-binding protein
VPERLTMHTLPEQNNNLPVMELSGIRKSFNVGTPIENEVLHGIDLILPQGSFAQ